MVEQEIISPPAPLLAGRESGLRILYLTPRFPYPPIKGDTLRVYHQLRLLSRDHSITLLAMADAPVSAADYLQVSMLCERVIMVPLRRWRSALGVAGGMLRRQPLQVGYYQDREVAAQLAALLQQPFDVLHVTLIRMLPYVWGIHRPPVVVDLIDSLGLNLEARRSELRGAKRLVYELEYARVRQYERAATRRFPRLVVSSPADREALGGERVEVIANGVEIERFAYRGEEERDPNTLIFTGNMGYEPNEAAVAWFAAEVWPRLREMRPDLRWQIAGARPTERVRALHRPEAGIEVLGPVPDLGEYLGKATVAIAPMRNGSGIQNKVLEALAVGTPLVATSIANRGILAEDGKELLLADDAGDFAAAVARLLDEPETRERLRRVGRAFVEAHYRWEDHTRRLTEIYESLRPVR